MSNYLSLNFALEWIVLAAAALAAITVLHSFIVGHHYIIPTISLINMIILAHLAYYGFHGEIWVQKLLFWAALVVCAHCFFSLFWAKAPAALLGPFFFPIYIGGVMLFGVLAWRRYLDVF